jgi:glycosyltransferase involved in cell wall biosynthesis
MVLTGAASYGLPIVTTDARAIPYLIRDGVNGILTPPENVERAWQTS